MIGNNPCSASGKPLYYTYMNKKNVQWMLHGAGFAAINTACVSTIFNFNLPGESIWLAAGVMLWIWADAGFKFSDAN